MGVGVCVAMSGGLQSAFVVYFMWVPHSTPMGSPSIKCIHPDLTALGTGQSRLWYPTIGLGLFTCTHFTVILRSMAQKGDMSISAGDKNNGKRETATHVGDAPGGKVRNPMGKKK